jgi:hypothetical protein
MGNAPGMKVLMRPFEIIRTCTINEPSREAPMAIPGNRPVAGRPIFLYRLGMPRPSPRNGSIDHRCDHGNMHMLHPQRPLPPRCRAWACVANSGSAGAAGGSFRPQQTCENISTGTTSAKIRTPQRRKDPLRAQRGGCPPHHISGCHRYGT